MLFAVKRDATRSLGLGLGVAAIAALARRALGISWSLDGGPDVLLWIGVGLVAIVLSDALVHGLLALVAGDAYLDTFGALVDYFRDQSQWAVLAGGLLAAAEELLFRGALLAGLLQLTLIPAPLSVLLVSLLFGAAHYLPSQRLRPMALWAVLEGVILGGLLVVTGSLLVPVVVHALHDVLGFSLFAWLRRGTNSRRESFASE